MRPPGPPSGSPIGIPFSPSIRNECLVGMFVAPLRQECDFPVAPRLVAEDTKNKRLLSTGDDDIRSGNVVDKELAD